MANGEQLERLLAGVEEWNTWRVGEGEEIKIDLRRADLSNADLGGAYLWQAHLWGANFSGANLIRARFLGANLIRANLEGALLYGAILENAKLIRANLIGANLSEANLEYGALFDADLSGANLSSAYLRGSGFRGANLSGAHFSQTSLLGILDLSGALGLAEVKHALPSDISTFSLERTAQGLKNAPPERRGEVETFLRGAGIEEHLIEYYRSRIGMPIEFYSGFISYSHVDKPFAQRLYNDLQAKGIRCWLDEHDMVPGDRIYDVVNQAIRSTDRVLLCCSLASLTSPWVEDEIAMTFEKEREGQGDVLIPLDLDGYLFDGWKSGSGARVRSRVAARFEGWDTDARLYEERLERVVEAMRPRGDRDGE